jgi:hypothetical protein
LVGRTYTTLLVASEQRLVLSSSATPLTNKWRQRVKRRLCLWPPLVLVLVGSVGINNYLAAKDALAAQQLAAQGAVSTAAAAPATAAQIGAGTEAATIMANAYNPAFQAAAIEAAGATAAGTTAGTTAGVTAVGTTAGAAAPAAVAAPAAAAPAAGPLAAVGTIATPLLIGAGAALLLDQVFDIF